eukprot:TRINITY_DN31375_c0_g1_i1.p1 TRINITY_DN31375_c0_g1~~TRINITY_DN31375_c0_g1_i1.p1  ORF type:complete len:255 (-),score=30.98 TRINITY_DN31375_c0_g1_i1:129-869(-)
MPPALDMSARSSRFRCLEREIKASSRYARLWSLPLCLLACLLLSRGALLFTPSHRHVTSASRSPKLVARARGGFFFEEESGPVDYDDDMPWVHRAIDALVKAPPQYVLEWRPRKDGLLLRHMSKYIGEEEYTLADCDFLERDIEGFARISPAFIVPINVKNPYTSDGKTMLETGSMDMVIMFDYTIVEENFVPRRVPVPTETLVKNLRETARLLKWPTGQLILFRAGEEPLPETAAGYYTMTKENP